MPKINIGTHLNGVLTAAVREALAADPPTWSTPARTWVWGRQAATAEVARLITLISAR
ncbi:MAG: hypothetical protein ACYCZY_03760 [Lacisediminihabitans sp.]